MNIIPIIQKREAQAGGVVAERNLQAMALIAKELRRTIPDDMTMDADEYYRWNDMIVCNELCLLEHPRAAAGSWTYLNLPLAVNGELIKDRWGDMPMARIEAHYDNLDPIVLLDGAVAKSPRDWADVPLVYPVMRAYRKAAGQ